MDKETKSKTDDITGANCEIKKYSRIPQSFVFDNKALTRQYDDSAVIIQDLMIFYSYNKLNVNLFGEFEFTMNDFCASMGYNRTTLQRTMNMKNPPVLDDHVFDSPFEYALYRCLRENVIVSRKKDGREENYSYKLLDHLFVNYDRTTKKLTKRTYVIKFSNEFLNNILKEYFILDYEDYNRITNKKIEIMGVDRGFYLTLCKMITVIRNQRYITKKEGKEWNPLSDNIYRTSVDLLCKQLNITEEEPKAKKKYLTARLNKIQKQLKNTQFSYQYQRYKDDSRWKYAVNFYFPQEVLDEYDEKLRAKFIYKLMIQCTEQFGRINPTYKMNTIKGRLSPEDEIKFFNWFGSSEDLEDTDYVMEGKSYHRMGKFSIFKNIYQEIYLVPYLDKEIDFSLLTRDHN